MRTKAQIAAEALPSPLLLFAIGLCVGGMVYFALDFEPAGSLLWLAIVIAVGGTLATYRYQSLVFKVFLLLLAAFSGSLYAQYTAENIAQSQSRLQNSGGRFIVEGIVREEEYRAQGVWRLTLEEARIDGRRLNGTIRIRTEQSLSRGTALRVPARLFVPSPPVIPGGFDFERHAFFRHLVAVGYALEPIEVLRPPEADQSASNVLREILYHRIARDFSFDTASLLRALMLGDRQSLSEMQLQDFRASGLAHLLAISGMHVGMIALVVFGFIRRTAALFPAVILRWPIHRHAALVSVLIAWFYVTLAGGSVSMYRAFIMISLLMLALIIEREILQYRSIALAALAIFALQPEVVTSPSFQLSFSAVLVLIGYFRSRSLQREGFEHLPRILRGVIDIFCTTLLITLVTFPFLWGHFQALYPYGVIANVLAIPLMGILIMPLILLYGIFSVFALEMVVAPLLEASLKVMLGWAQWISDWSGSTVTLPHLPEWLMLLWGGLGLIVLLCPRAWRGLMFIIAVSLVLIGLLIAQFTRPAPDIVYHTPSKSWALVLKQGLLFPPEVKAEGYVGRQWQSEFNRKNLPWESEGHSGALLWRCQKAFCDLKKHGHVFRVWREVPEDCPRQFAETVPVVWNDELCPDSDFRAISVMFSLTPSGVLPVSLREWRGLRPWTSKIW